MLNNVKWWRIILNEASLSWGSPLLCLSLKQGRSLPPQHLLLSSLLLLSPTHSCPLNLMVPSSSLIRPCDSWQASVLYDSPPPWGSVIDGSVARMESTRMLMHRGKNVYIRHNNDILHMSYTFSMVYWRCHTLTSHISQRCNLPWICHARWTQRTHSIQYIPLHVPRTHSQSTPALTHSLCGAAVTLDTGSPPPSGSCHVWMCHTDTCMTGFDQEDWAVIRGRLMHHKSQQSESWWSLCSLHLGLKHTEDILPWRENEYTDNIASIWG